MVEFFLAEYSKEEKVVFRVKGFKGTTFADLENTLLKTGIFHQHNKRKQVFSWTGCWEKHDVAKVRGRTPDLSKFHIHIVPAHGYQHPAISEDLGNIGGIHSSNISSVGLKVPKTDVWKAKDAFQAVLLE
ncbi:hypothetical protein GGI03_001509 [Coemansia sp. RSA 2337]|nr:hypothetical protein GGI03_001509 [Coemansia sp. RSA 2337]